MIGVVDMIEFVGDDRVRDTHECRGCVCIVRNIIEFVSAM